MKKANKKYEIEVYFQLGGVAWPYTLKLSDEQVRILWKDVADVVIPSNVDVKEVIRTESDWDYVADAAAERLFNYINDHKKLDNLMNEACS